MALCTVAALSVGWVGFVLAAANAGPAHPAGRESCLVAVEMRGCGFDPGLAVANVVVISPDGRHLYTAGEGGSVLAFRIGDGLVRILGPGGCLSHLRVPDCAVLRGVWDAVRLAFTRDGRTLYVTSPRVGPAPSSTVAVLRRDRRTGSLRQLPGRAGCVNERGDEGCARAALDSPVGVEVSPDGRHVYVTNSWVGDVEPTHINVFQRVRGTGALRAVQTLPALESTDVAVSPTDVTSTRRPTRCGVSGASRAQGG